MLESITISNFKAIKYPGLRLEGLTNVNYLVGENGSGKSSVLELFSKKRFNCYCGINPNSFFQSTDYNNKIIKTEFKNRQIKYKRSISKETWWYKEDTINEFDYYIFDLSQVQYYSYKEKSIDYTSTILNNINNKNGVFRHRCEKFINLITKIGLNLDKKVSTHPHIQKPIEFYSKDFFLDSDETVKLNQIYRSEGERYIFILLLEIFHHTFLYSNERSNANVVFICDEIENRLHPKYQKYIPIFLAEFEKYCFNDILKNRNVSLQFLISTHSPFIISEAGKIAEEEKAKGEKPSQKVYLIEKGQTKSISGVLGEGKNGYWGTNVIDTVCDMLGAGFDDIIGQGLNSSITQVIKSKTIFCEGSENNDFVDADIYQLIFGCKIGDCKINFVSCGGSSDTVKIFKLTNQIQEKVKTTNQNLIILDGDKKGEYDGVNCLKMSCLEACLLSPEIVFEKWDFNDDQRDRYLEKYKLLKVENIKHKNSDGIKNFLDQEKICLLKDFSYLDLAKLITPQTTVYQELHDCIFGSSVKPEK